VDPLAPELGTDPAREAPVTIDSGAPSSRVNALPGVTLPGRFLVSWGGVDDAAPGPAGSGIAAYTIWVSTDGGAYVQWLSQTTRTAFPFTGIAGHTYRFVSEATDHVGNLEALRTTADATTSVSAVSIEAFHRSRTPPPPPPPPPSPPAGDGRGTPADSIGWGSPLAEFPPAPRVVNTFVGPARPRAFALLPMDVGDDAVVFDWIGGQRR